MGKNYYYSTTDIKIEDLEGLTLSEIIEKLIKLRQEITEKWGNIDERTINLLDKAVFTVIDHSDIEEFKMNGYCSADLRGNFVLILKDKKEKK